MKTAAIVLAAGKGTRLNCKETNKVMLSINGTPMIDFSIKLLKKTKLNPIIVVVGFKKEHIMKYLEDKVWYAVQKKRLGTAHAVSCAIKIMPKTTSNVLIVNGDDSYLYSTDLLRKLIKHHEREKADLTLLTLHKDNPKGLGRIIRDEEGKIIGIVEEKNANSKQKKIQEINPQCWVFKTSFLKKYLPKVKKDRVTGEYYLTELISMAVKNNAKIEDVKGGKIVWQGVNTSEELEEVRKMMKENKFL